MYLKFVYYIFFSCIIIFTQCSENCIDKSKLEIFKCESVFGDYIETYCLQCELCPKNIYYEKKDMDITELCTKGSEVVFKYKNALLNNIEGKYSSLDIEDIVKKYIKDKNFKDCFIRIKVYEDGYVIEVDGKKYYSSFLYVYIIPDKEDNEKYYTVFKMQYDGDYYLDKNNLFFYKSGENKSLSKIELKVLSMKNLNKMEADKSNDVKNSNNVTSDNKNEIQTPTTTQQNNINNSTNNDKKKSYKMEANMLSGVGSSNNIPFGYKNGMRTSTTTQQKHINNSNIKNNKKPYRMEADMSNGAKNSNNITLDNKDVIQTHTTSQQKDTNNNSSIKDTKKSCC